MRVERLGDLCHIRIGKTPSRSNPDYWGGSIPWATISDMSRSPLLMNTREGITDLAVQELGMRAAATGTLLYSFKLTIGKMAVAGVPLYTNEAIAALTPKEPTGLDSTFLRFALRTVDGGATSSMAVKGRTLNNDTLSSLLIPMVPIDEQRRLATHLTEQMVAVAAAEALSRAEQEAIEALPAALIRRAFDALVD